ncbi:hypothetical protein [Prosthecobacter sp.]|jgi:hypothetical protein|uniref:hypothetical protein n=1 Tax=Prosthecobacter sp. TaxID=1965333 RepID=UPI0037C8EA3E
MVKGINIFRDHFRAFEGAMTLIGGAACDEWFGTNGMNFRATNDLDLVIMMDQVEQTFLDAMRAFIQEGGYQTSERSDGVPILYRFANPTREDFPSKLELSSRKPEGFELSDGQKSIPVFPELGRHSLSAILLDDAYFGLIQTHHDERDGLWVANASSLIPLKAHAWLNLTKAKAAGETVDSGNIKKHRADVFGLAATLPGAAGPELPDSVVQELEAFLRAFPINSTDWPAILASLRSTLGIRANPETLRTAIQIYFRLPAA